MLPKKLYNLLVIIFPFIYLLHNAEEWFVFSCKSSFILSYIQAGIKVISSINPEILSMAFGVALIFTTIIPIVVTLIIWRNTTPLNIMILLVIAFVTLTNAVSHITTSIFLGFLAPGLITGLILCLPYSIAVIHFIRKYNVYTMRQYLFFCCSSVAIYVFGVALSWLIGLLIISIF